MSLLSIEDLKREIGKGILIYPFKIDNIKAHSINLTASRFAWSLKTKKSIYDSNSNSLVLKAKETSLIYTQESIYVKNHIGGTYHSKVGLVTEGLSHIGTTLDPEYLGLSLIAIHNNSSKDYVLKVGSSFVTLIFHYLNTPTYIKSHNNEASQISKISDFDRYNDFKMWYNKNDWVNTRRNLKSKLLESDEFKRLQKSIKADKENFNKWEKIKQKFKGFVIGKYILVAFSSIVILILFVLLNNYFSLSIRISDIIIPFITFFFGVLTTDLNNFFD